MIARFNKKIYSGQAVKKAVKDYARLAKLTPSRNKNYFLVKVKKIQPEIKKFFQDEFSNYVLSLMNK